VSKLSEAAENTSLPSSTQPARPALTPGKVGLWLFLGTEVMFFTGLIGSYIVLRAGSPSWAYSNLFPPGTRIENRTDARGIVIDSIQGDVNSVAQAIHGVTGVEAEALEHQLESLPTVVLVTSSDSIVDTAPLENLLRDRKIGFHVAPLETTDWPRPYNNLTNPLSIDLTAINTFILICSSVTMVLALAAIQRGDKVKLSLWLLATILIGSTFLGIQIYEYYQLMEGHRYSVGVSSTGHFRPDGSLFASCFFTMTGFHGAHVTGGVIALSVLWLRSLFGGYTRNHHGPIEVAGLYWHFVDLVWILLFTVVYLL
jgi:cytochrome c oxidase subunit III